MIIRNLMRSLPGEAQSFLYGLERVMTDQSLSEKFGSSPLAQCHAREKSMAQSVDINAAKTRAEKATIRILRDQDADGLKPTAQGVLVPGGYIITAAHCIEWHGTGRMALGEPYFETIRTSDGKQHLVRTCAVEPMTDIAVLRSVGDYDPGLFRECQAFEEFCEATEPVPVSGDDFPGAKVKYRRAPKGRFRPDYEDVPLIPVHVLTHTGAWITGNANRCGPLNSPTGGKATVTFSTPIEFGTSGSSVIDDRGLLVGVISYSGGGIVRGTSEGSMPRPHLALPVWLWNRINRSQA
jgi:Trypsin-like peptidase domain